MRHPLAPSIAGCVLLAAALPAAAQDSITLYGIADAAVQYSNADASATATGDGKAGVTVVNGGQSSSRLGLRGVERLGGDLSAVFTLEHWFTLDTGGLNPRPGDASAATQQFWNSQAWVGLQGGFGRLTLGRQFVPLYDVLRPLDATAYTFPNNWSAYHTNRLSNSAAYRTPTVGGLVGSVMWAAGENLVPGQRSGDSYGAGLQWTAGPLVVSGGHMTYGRTVAGSPDGTEWGAGAALRFGERSQFGVGRIFSDRSGRDVTHSLLSGSLGVFAGTLYLNYAHVAPDGGPSSGRLGLGYAMPLSRRTNAYVATGMESDVAVGTRTVDPMRVVAGVRHLF
jgi:predicted porin